MPFQFEWDPAKAIANFAKHGVSFEEARDVFDDPLSQTVDDVAHTLEEPRYWTIGDVLVRAAPGSDPHRPG